MEMKKNELKIKNNSPQKLDIEREQLGMPRVSDQQYDYQVDFTDVIPVINKLLSNQVLTDENLPMLGFVKCEVDDSYYWYLKIKRTEHDTIYLISNVATKCVNEHFFVTLEYTGFGQCKNMQDVKLLISALTKYL